MTRSEQLRHFHEDLGKPIRRIARALDVKPSTYRNYITGAFTPPIQVLADMRVLHRKAINSGDVDKFFEKVGMTKTELKIQAQEEKIERLKRDLDTQIAKIDKVISVLLKQADYEQTKLNDNGRKQRRSETTRECA